MQLKKYIRLIIFISAVSLSACSSQIAKQSTSTTSVAQSPTSAASAISVPSTPIVVIQQTYTNQANGYQFHYPSSLQEINPGTEPFVAKNTQITLTCEYLNNASEYSSIIKEIQTQEKNGELYAWSKTIKGHQAYSSAAALSNGNYERYTFIQDGKNYIHLIIDTEYKAGAETAVRELTDQVVNSLTFTSGK